MIVGRRGVVLLSKGRFARRKNDQEKNGNHQRKPPTDLEMIEARANSPSNHRRRRRINLHERWHGLHKIKDFLLAHEIRNSDEDLSGGFARL